MPAAMSCPGSVAHEIVSAASATPPRDRWSCGVIAAASAEAANLFFMLQQVGAGARAGHRQLSVGEQRLQELTAARSILHRIIAQGDYIAGLHGRRSHAQLAQRPRR